MLSASTVRTAFVCTVMNDDQLDGTHSCAGRLTVSKSGVAAATCDFDNNLVDRADKHQGSFAPIKTIAVQHHCIVSAAVAVSLNALLIALVAIRIPLVVSAHRKSGHCQIIQVRT